MTDTTAEILGDEPDDYGTDLGSVPTIPLPDTPPQDSKPNRPTTRAGRKAAAAARRANASGKDSAPKATKTTPRKATLESRLASALVSMGGVVMAGAAVAGSQPLQADGLVLIEHSANMAAAINKVADQDPRVKAALEKMLTAGVWSGVMAAMLPVLLAVAGNHGLVPPQLAGIFAVASGQPQPEPAAA